jgi:hypothetical protein
LNIILCGLATRSNDHHQRWEPAATELRKQCGPNGWLRSAACSGWTSSRSGAPTYSPRAIRAARRPQERRRSVQEQPKSLPTSRLLILKWR